MLSVRLLVRRRGAELSLGPALLLLFLGKTWPGNETLWESPWEPPGPRPGEQINSRRKERNVIFIKPRNKARISCHDK